MRLYIPLAIFLSASLGQAASTLSSQQVLDICANATPTPSPRGWQDYFFKPTGKVTRTKTGYSLRGTENEAPGICIVTLGQKEAIFKFDNFKELQAGLDEYLAPSDFDDRCDETVVKMGKIPEKT